MGRSVIRRTFACLPEGKPKCLTCRGTYKDVSSALPCEMESSVVFLHGNQVCSAGGGLAAGPLPAGRARSCRPHSTQLS